jgi:hypothetical protein|eukprot:COSAG01_NODE_9281_length_2495_cov_9.276793_2_plen_203_part_00
MVWECQPPGSDRWVIPGQAGYESCITREGGFNARSSQYARPAKFFGLEMWHTKSCPFSIRTALSLHTGSLDGGAWGVEHACSDGTNPDWITSGATCSSACAAAFYGFWASCGGLKYSGSQSQDLKKPMFWRYNATGSTIDDKLVTITLSDLEAFYKHCLQPDGSCPTGTSTDTLRGLCVPNGFQESLLGCPFSCSKFLVTIT